jgi:hypothetical protein
VTNIIENTKAGSGCKEEIVHSKTKSFVERCQGKAFFIVAAKEVI